eukprot:58788-Rhodomonas_salina.1
MRVKQRAVNRVEKMRVKYGSNGGHRRVNQGLNAGQRRVNGSNEGQKRVKSGSTGQTGVKGQTFLKEDQSSPALSAMPMPFPGRA